MTPPDLLPAAPEIIVLAMACVILIADLRAPSRTLAYALTLATLAVAALVTIVTANPEPVRTFGGMFLDDPLSDLVKLMLYGSVAVVLIYAREYLVARGMFQGEFFVLALFALLGMMVMVSACHFLTLYLGLELLSLSLYGLVALQRDSKTATEAAMKYFVLGALASGMLLYGMSMIYGVTGSLETQRIAQSIAMGVGQPTVLAFGIVFIVAGFAFKLGVVPFHMWIPDVYHGAPTAVTLFIGSAPKLAAFAFVLRILADGLQDRLVDWQPMLVILALLSLAVGNIAAIAQSNLKRMLAYSTISHMGFVVLGILTGTATGYSAAMFYAAIYVLTSLGSFGMILLMSREGFEAEELDDYRGLNRRSPWYAFIMLNLMLSLAGIPFWVGFFGKLVILQAVVDAGLVWVAVVAVLFSVIGAFYYLRVIKLMYFEEPHDAAPIVAGRESRILMGANGLATIALGLMPQPLLALCATAIQGSL